MKKKIEKQVDTKEVMVKIANFIHEHPGFLFIVANPIRDEILIGFNNKQSFVKFPEAVDLGHGVVAGVLIDSKFNAAMGSFITGISKGLDIKGENGYAMSNFIDAVGGSLQAINNKK
jgi:hypothetical protein